MMMMIDNAPHSAKSNVLEHSSSMYFANNEKTS